jgi:serine/threonine protein kinase/WD40 repeat protein
MPNLTPLAPEDPPQLGPYILLHRLGRGGMGDVYLAQGPDAARVAVKAIRSELVRQQTFHARFRREVTAASRVPGLWTARVLDSGLDGDRPYLVTEYVDGDSLDEVISQRPLSGTALERFAFEVAAALTAIHAAGVVHRDLKPSNVMLSREGGAKVIDFGIAKALEGATAITSFGVVLGTPRWMAPEQRRSEPVTSAADVFVWGRLVLYAATGQLPNDDPNLGGGSAADLAVLNEPLRGLVHAALNPEPSRRPRAKAITLELLGTGISDSGAAMTQRLWAMTTPDHSADASGHRLGPDAAEGAMRRSPPRAPRGTRPVSDGVLVGLAVLLLAGLAIVYELAWGDLAAAVSVATGLAALLFVSVTIATLSNSGARRQRLPSELQRALRGNAKQRAAVIPQLTELRATNRNSLATAANVALEQLARDNQRNVRSAANKALRGAPPLAWREPASPDLAERAGSVAGRMWEGLRLRIWPPRGRAEATDVAVRVAEFEQPAPVVSVAMDAEGRRVLTRGSDHTLRAWSSRGGDPLVVLPLPATTARDTTGIAVSADGTWMSAAGDETVSVWSMTSGSQTDRFHHSAPTSGVAFSRDGLRILAASVEDHRRATVMAQAWEVSTRTHHGLVRTEGVLPWTRPFSLAISPDGSRLAAVGGLAGAARIWDLHNGRRIAVLWPARMRGNRALPLAFNGDAGLLAIVGRRGRLVRVWDVDACQVIRRFRTLGRVVALAFTADGWRLATGGEKFVQVWDLSDDGEVARVWHGSEVTGLAFSADAALLVASGRDGTTRIWRLGSPDHHGD